MMKPRSEYIYNYQAYLKAFMCNDEAWDYMKRAFDFMETMKPRTILSLTANEKQLPWLLVATGAFMDSLGHGLHYELNTAYTKLRRNS